MEITLENFKCFESAKIKFENNKFQLITGPSGFGKTSIFEAIKFVFWGNKSTDIITFSKKKCKVEIIWKGFKFIRTKNPNIFTIQNISTNEFLKNPEEYIERYITFYNFGFLFLKEESQRKVIDKILNQNVAENIEFSCKKILKEGYNILKEKQILLQSYKTSFSELPEIKIIEKPIFSNIENIDNLNYKLKNLNIDLKDKENTLAVYYSNKKKSEEIDIDINDEINLKNKLQELNSSKDLYIKIQKEKDILKNNIEDYRKKISSLQHIYNEIDNIDQEELFIFKKKVEDNNISYNNINTLWKKCIVKQKTNNISTIKKWINESNISISNNDELTCPSCKTKLYIDENSNLKLLNTNPDFYILIQILEYYNNIDLNYSEEKLYEMEKNIKKRNKVCNDLKIYSEMEKNLCGNLNDIEKNNYFKNIDIEKINIEILNLNKLLEKIYLKKSYQCNNVDENKIKKDIYEIKKEIKNIHEIINKIKDYEKDIKIWESNEKILKIKNSYIQNIKEIEDDLSDIQNKISELEIFKSIINESHMKSIYNFIEKINHSLDFLTNKFFNNGEISIVFNILKESNKNKIKSIKYFIDIKLYHNGNEMKISNLSSGELARVSLAIDVAIYKLTNTAAPLFLDEVTSNLDSSTSIEILETINEFASDSQIFVIAHQATEGIFDKIYDSSYFESCISRLK